MSNENKPEVPEVSPADAKAVGGALTQVQETLKGLLNKVGGARKKLKGGRRKRKSRRGRKSRKKRRTKRRRKSRRGRKSRRRRRTRRRRRRR